MASIGGDIIEVTFNHPTLGSGTLYPKAGEASSYDLGGFRGDDDANGLDGGGNTIRVLKQNRWFFEVPVANDMNTKNELEKISAMAGDPLEATWTVTHINGSVYTGTGAPVGDVKFDGMAATFPLKISGGGGMSKQV